jgi:hypothetical protein
LILAVQDRKIGSGGISGKPLLIFFWPQTGQLDKYFPEKGNGKYSANRFLFTQPHHIFKNKKRAALIFYGTRQGIYDIECPCSANTFTVHLKSSTRTLLMFWR